MLPLDTLAATTFEPLLHGSFELTSAGGPVALELVEVSRARRKTPGLRDPFALLFRAPPGSSLMQGVYRVEHATLGVMEIFLVPVRADDTGWFLEAVFN